MIWNGLTRPTCMRVVERLSEVPQLAADVCVIGAGPVGLSLAIDLCRRGLTVALLESGLRRPSPVHQALSDANISNETHAPMSMAVCRALGGASWLWGGRCVPLDPLDYEARPHVPESGWPISAADVAPYHTAAAHLLDCGSGVFALSGELVSDSAVRVDTLERWSREPNFGRHLRQDEAPTLTIVLDATVVDLEFAGDGEAVTGVVVASQQGRNTFRRAGRFVLACGGVETARLLLNVQARIPHLFGGTDGALGRYYMGHLSGTIADIELASDAVAQRFDYQMDRRMLARFRLTISKSAQLAEGLPNTAFYPTNPRIDNPEHRSGILSTAFLLLSVPAIGRRLVSEPIRRMQVNNRRYWAHLHNVLFDAPETARAVFRLLQQRFLQGRRRPSFFLPGLRKYPLHFHAEHLPNRSSRVRLVNDVDALGMRRVSIELRFSQQDASGIFRAHRVLAKGLREVGLGELRMNEGPSGAEADILRQANDGYHQIGLARMGFDKRDSVVDRDCRVFGVRNLFVVGTSVFRTSSQANPTFTAAALALRLAEHLDRTAVGARRGILQ